ncbi:Metallo-dependent phosphatase-like protein [Pavlovales sp. CCMP2436]|nr:Metallo-dependent phosphatase-like protein [Pavlovales sp. CCMP2436]
MGCVPSRQATEQLSLEKTTERSERTYGAWSQAEENDEHDFLEAQKTAVTVQNKLQAQYPEQHEAHLARARQASQKLGRRAPPPEHYTGPHLRAPWTVEQADALLDYLVTQTQTGADNVHISYMEDVLREGIEIFGAMESVVNIPVPTPESGSTLVVVGDTHGQLNDVLYIFSVHGPPSPSNVYLFNGDIADRGPQACEICALLLAYKLACPEALFINRGNHENSDINERPAKNGGGFAAEVRSKYDRETFRLFQQFFCVLPLAAVLGDECIVVHGGLCRLNPTIDQMKGVSRRMQCPDMPLTLDETILFDSLWADPAPDGEPAGQGRGGVCYSFDEAATSKFLRLNGLSLVIRSHQLPPKQRGYMLHHANKVLTIFSASNYCGVCANHGSILILRGGMSEVWEYRAPPIDVLLASWDESRAAREKERKKRFASLLPKRKTLGIGDIALAQIRSTRWGGHSKERRVSVGGLSGAESQLILSDYVSDERKRAGVAGMEVAIVRALKERICLHRADLLRAMHKESAACCPLPAAHCLLPPPPAARCLLPAAQCPLCPAPPSPLLPLTPPAAPPASPPVAADKSGKGLLPLKLWQDAVQRVLGVPVDWGLYSELFVLPEPPARAEGRRDMVDIVKSLERYQIRLQERYAGWQANVLSRAYGKLQASDLSIDSLKARFDANRDGNVTAAEVLDVLASFDLALARPQLERALLWMNMQEGVRFEASSFIAQLFVMCHDGAPRSPVRKSERLKQNDGDETVRSEAAAEEHAFSYVRLADGRKVDGVEYVSGMLTHLVDTDKDGELSPLELQAVSEHIWAMIDTDGDGYLSYDEFADAIMRLIQDEGIRKDMRIEKASLSRAHALHLAARIDICTQIYEQQHALQKAFIFFDKDEDGMILPSDFTQAVAMVGSVISRGNKAAEPFTPEQIEILATHCPKSESGQLNYNAFLSAFVVVDTHQQVGAA